jgi:hypothetical protein
MAKKVGYVSSVPVFRPRFSSPRSARWPKREAWPRSPKTRASAARALYKTLSAGAHPRFETINSVLHALGVKFAVVAERES